MTSLLDISPGEARPPETPSAYLKLGNLLKDQNRLDEAIAAYGQAIALNRDYCEAHANLGVTLLMQGRSEESIAASRNAVRLRPDYPETHLNLGLALHAQGSWDEAIAAFRTALALRPDYALAHFSLANSLRESHRFDQAIGACGAAIANQPDYAAAYLNRANIFHEQGRLDEAFAGYSRALALKPDFVDAHSNLGNVLRKQGRVDEAVAACRRALAIQPDFPAAHLNLSLALLLKGQFEEGWREYEWRWKGGTSDVIPRKFRQPRWRGEDLTGKTLLLHGEQGLGDTLQFARFAPLLAGPNKKIMLAVQPPLVSLLGKPGWPNVTVNNGAALSGFDFELPLMSVPLVLGITESNIPARVPYLAADPGRVEAWRDRLPKDGLKIGIVWQGRPDPKVDVGRFFPLRHCAPLAMHPGLHLISLQKHHGLDQLDALPPGMRIQTLGPDFDAGPDAFLDTAAVMMNLDLIITADTSTAHLAGALARPTWIALKEGPDWRWLLQREDSPWYPTVRLFRQRTLGNWDDVFAAMTRELPAFMGDAHVFETARTAAPPRRRAPAPQTAQANISVVIPCFNGAEFLPRAIASILNQRIDGTEILIVDDASTDDTPQILERLRQETPNLRIIRQAVNGGPAKARNAGLREATGRHVCFLDADDAYGDEVFARCLAVLDAAPWVQAVEFPIRLLDCHREVSPVQLGMIMNSLPSNVIVRRDLANAVGGFPEDPDFRTKRAGEDCAFRGALNRWGTVHRIQHVFLDYQVRRGSHFDLFLDTAPGEMDEDARIGAIALSRHQETVCERMKAAAGIGRTHLIEGQFGDHPLRFQVFDNPASKQHATETLTGTTYPKIPFLSAVERVLDIGANVGASAMFFASNYPAARIVALEPARQAFVLLACNTIHHPNIRVHNVGLYDRTTRRTLYKGLPDSVTNSVVPNVLTGNVQEEIQLVAADAFVRQVGMERPDIIKIDTEGCEIPIISTILESFRNARAIYLEYHSDEDRLELDRLLSGTHLLVYGKIGSPHRGELVYVHRQAFPSPQMRDHWKISPDRGPAGP
jgi:FkbM family methyltransferase